jgi:cytochrome c
MKHLCLPLIAASSLLTPTDARASEELSRKAGCAACHAQDKKGVGPSWKDIAARHRGDPKALAALTAKVRQGSQGTWGAVPMVPVPPAQIGEAPLKALLEWVLKR